MITRVVAVLNGLLLCIQFTDFFICIRFTNFRFDLLYFDIKAPVCQSQGSLGTGFKVARALSLLV